MLAPEIIGGIVNTQALAHNLRTDIVACVIIQESGGDPFAIRWEPAFYNAHLAGKAAHDLSGFVPSPSPNLSTELLQRSMSFGLMQVLGDTARWCAKSTFPYLTVLCDPDKGVDAGVQSAFLLSRTSKRRLLGSIERL